jgi:benzoyl-CoA 2,3-dioxygenase component B
MRLRDDYTKDCQGGVNRWNKIIEKAGIKFALTLPSVAFHRHVGEFKDINSSPDGKLLSDEQWAKMRDQWLPSKSDGDYIASLMKPCWEAGRYAPWIAPPKVGIDNKGADFEYVKIHQA